jgi:precorrin-2 methylase
VSAALFENSRGKLVGVGTGPGDPELLTLKAVRAIENADVLAFFCKKGSSGNGRGIVEAFIRPGTLEMPLVYPVTVESDKNGEDYRGAIAAFFDQSAMDIAAHLDAGRLNEALYVERGTMANSHAVPLIERDASPAPYFSLVLVPGWKTRPAGGEAS